MNKQLAYSLFFSTILFVLLILVNMPSAGRITFWTVVTMYPLYGIVATIISVFYYYILTTFEYIFQKIALFVIFLGVLFCFVILTYPPTDVFALQDIPDIVASVRAKYNSVKPTDITLEYPQNDDFIKKMIMKKYNLQPYFYEVYVYESGKCISNYVFVISMNAKIYLTPKSNTVQYKIQNYTLKFEEEVKLLSGKKQKIYYEVTQYSPSLYTEKNSNDCIIKIKREEIFMYNFGFQDLVVWLSSM